MTKSYYDNTLNPIFNKYFGRDQILKGYKPPTYNKYCEPMEEMPYTYAFNILQRFSRMFARLVVKNADEVLVTVDNEDGDYM